MNGQKITSNYDLWKLKKARELLFEVYQYNFGDSSLRRVVSRLGTIISKLDIVIGEE